MLKYNVNLLQKDKDLLVDSDASDDENETSEDEIRKKRWRRSKRIVIRTAMESEEDREDSELSFSDFENVLKKIRENNKAVYRDLVMAGDEFQMAVFSFYNECYKQEFQPEDFSETTLMKLYKNKGVRTELKSNRFIHLKEH